MRGIAVVVCAWSAEGHIVDAAAVGLCATGGGYSAGYKAPDVPENTSGGFDGPQPTVSIDAAYESRLVDEITMPAGVRVRAGMRRSLYAIVLHVGMHCLWCTCHCTPLYLIVVLHVDTRCLWWACRCAPLYSIVLLHVCMQSP